jgi:putative nucleotidyltransferase with HDIG domain
MYDITGGGVKVLGLPDLKIDQALGKIKELPTLPDVVFKVNEVVNDPTTSAQDLENVISRDQAIAAKVLKLVNSAFYGLPGRVDTLSRAIPLLGFSTVRNLVMSVSIFDVSSITGVDIKEFWRHSFATSTIAQAIARADGLPDAESQSLAGLLHDVGKVLMFQHYPKHVHVIMETMEKKGISFIQAEKSLFSTDHAEIGAAIAEKWSFPVNIRAAIAYHHKPDSAGELSDFVSVTAAANLLAMRHDDMFILEKGPEVAMEFVEPYYNLSDNGYRAGIREMEKQMQFFENFIDRMEAFRRPSPLLQQEAARAKGDSGIWRLPGE